MPIAERGDDGTWITVADRSTCWRGPSRARVRPERRRPAALRHPVRGEGQHRRRRLARPRWPARTTRYVAEHTAPVVQRLLDAGAIMIGKTNLDQFATGLNGTRTPVPHPAQRLRQDLISGGSSSGSALAVALGQVPFTVATDTAGSGRVPPALNGVARVQAVPRADQHRRAGPGLPVAGLHQPDRRHRRRPRVRVRRRGRPRRRATRGAGRAAARPPTSTPSGSGCRTVGELEFFGDEAMAAAHAEAPRAGSPPRSRWSTPPLAPFLAGRRAALLRAVGRRAAGRVRRLPGRASGRRAAGDRDDHPRRRALQRGRRVPRRSTGWPS